MSDPVRDMFFEVAEGLTSGDKDAMLRSIRIIVDSERAIEREACAKIVDDAADALRGCGAAVDVCHRQLCRVADAIRARGAAK